MMKIYIHSLFTFAMFMIVMLQSIEAYNLNYPFITQRRLTSIKVPHTHRLSSLNHNLFNFNKKKVTTLSSESINGDGNLDTKVTTKSFISKLARINIPNLLSISRIIAIPIFLGSFIFNNKGLGVSIFLLSCLTDFVDGYLARKLNQVSEFGAFLDPVADKLMVAAALTLLICNLPVWWFAVPVAVVLLREIAVSALREWMAQQGVREEVKVGKLGKWKTALQMVSISLLLASSNPDYGDIVTETAVVVGESSVGLLQSFFLSIGLITFYGSTILTIVSGYQYFKAAWPRLSKTNILRIPEN